MRKGHHFIPSAAAVVLGLSGCPSFLTCVSSSSSPSGGYKQGCTYRGPACRYWDRQVRTGIVACTSVLKRTGKPFFGGTTGQKLTRHGTSFLDGRLWCRSHGSGDGGDLMTMSEKVHGIGSEEALKALKQWSEVYRARKCDSTGSSCCP